MASTVTLDAGSPTAQDRKERELSGLNVKRGYTSTTATIILTVPVLITGITYILLQWARHHTIYDALFVSMLIGATIILLLGIRHLGQYTVNRGLSFCFYLASQTKQDSGTEYFTTLCRSVMSLRYMTVGGIIYGLSGGSTPFVLSVWNNDVVLKVSLSIFMFFVNFVTGVAFLGLIIFLYYSVKMGKLVQANLWQIHNPTTDFFLGATRRLGLLASVYISVTLSSILFSLLPVTGFIVAYAIFAGVVMTTVIIIPSIPVARRLTEAKAHTLFEIDKQLYLSFYQDLDGDIPNRSNIDYDKVKTLLELREKVNGISTWPFRMKSILTAISVLLVSAIPIFLQITLGRYMP